MKLNKLLIVSFISIATALSVTSCKKSSGTSVVGTWKDVQSGTDLNGNGVIDPGEMTPDSAGTLTVTFNANGTGSEHVSVPGLFDTTIAIQKWSLQNGNKDLILTDGTGQTIFAHIVTLTNTDLVVADTSSPISWTAFKNNKN